MEEFDSGETSDTKQYCNRTVEGDLELNVLAHMTKTLNSALRCVIQWSRGGGVGWEPGIRILVNLCYGPFIRLAIPCLVFLSSGGCFCELLFVNYFAKLIPHSREYLALVGSFILIGLEVIVRIITLALRP